MQAHNSLSIIKERFPEASEPSPNTSTYCIQSRPLQNEPELDSVFAPTVLRTQNCHLFSWKSPCVLKGAQHTEIYEAAPIRELHLAKSATVTVLLQVIRFLLKMTATFEELSTMMLDHARWL